MPHIFYPPRDKRSTLKDLVRQMKRDAEKKSNPSNNKNVRESSAATRPKLPAAAKGKASS